MSLEEALRENTAALIANTEAHAKLAEVATAAAGGKSSASTKPKAEEKAEEQEEEEPKETAAEKKKRLAAEKKKKAAAEKKKEAEAEEAEAPELEGAVSAAALKKAAAAYLNTDDEDKRDDHKKNFIGALSHLGAKKLGDVDSDEDRARLAGYIAYWTAGLDVDFESIDALVEAAGSEGDDDLLG